LQDWKNAAGTIVGFVSPDGSIKSSGFIQANSNLIAGGAIYPGYGGTADLALARSTAGLLEINNGTTGNWAGFQAGTVKLRSLATPGTPTVTPTCASNCTATWGYKIVAALGDGTTTEAGAQGTTTAQNSTLNTNNYNTITCTAITGTTTYKFYRTTSGGVPATTGLIGTASTCSLVDNGLAGDSSTPPSINSTGSITVASVTPATSGAACTAGRIAWDANYIYVCTATNTWKRVSIATW
jgi:hypothetical protein